MDTSKQTSPKMTGTRLRAKERFELGVEVLTGAGACSVEVPVTMVITTSTDALTLANGYEGQIKIVIMKTDGGDGTLTPASYANGTQITFDTALEMWMGIFHAGSWYDLGTTTGAVT
jgi:hypothetical protein